MARNQKKRFLAFSLSFLLAAWLIATPLTTYASMFPIGGFLGKIGTNVTLAEVIISQLAGAGAGVTNTSWLSQLNNAFGTAQYSIGEMYSQGLFDFVPNAAGTAYEIIDTGFMAEIASKAEWVDLGLDAMFTVDSVEAAEWAIPAATGTQSLLSSIGSGVNLGSFGSAGLAVGGGIALGLLLNHINQQFGKNITAGQPMDLSTSILNNIPNGGTVAYGIGNSTKTQNYYIFAPNYIHLAGWWNGSRYYVSGYNQSNATWNTEIKYAPINNPNNLQRYVSRSISANTVPQSFQTFYDVVYGVPQFNSQTDALNYLNGIKNGTVTPIGRYSPDIIGQNGNAIGNYTENQYNTNLTNFINNPSKEGVKPIPYDEYIDWVNDANENTNNGDVTTNQGDLLKDFIRPFIDDDIDTDDIPKPDTDTDNPIPDQPDYKPKQTEISETEIDIADPYTSPDLLDKFPFCIPNDIKTLFSKFTSETRSAPHIVWNYHSLLFNYDINIDIDFSPYDDVAALFRTLELIAFIIALMVGTRKLIGD